MAKKDGAFFGATLSNDTLSKVDHVSLEIQSNPKIRPNRSKAAQYLMQLGYVLHRSLRAEGLIVKSPPPIHTPDAENNNK